MMDSSLSLIFMDNNLSSIPVSWNEPAESSEDLKHLLVYASMELESTRAAAKAQGTLHEARVKHLEELLQATRKERDEAREQCLKLQERLANSAGYVGSGLSSVVALQDLGRHENSARLPDRDSLSCNHMHSSISSSPSGLLQIDTVSSIPELSTGGGNLSEIQWKFRDLQELEQHLDMGHTEQQQQHQPFPSPALLEELDLQESLQLQAKRGCHLAIASSTATSSFPSPISFDDSPPLEFDLQADSSLDLQHTQEWAASLAESALPCQSSFPKMDSLPITEMCSPVMSVEVPHNLFVPCLQNGPSSAISVEVSSDSLVPCLQNGPASAISVGVANEPRVPCLPNRSPSAISGDVSNHSFVPCLQNGPAVASLVTSMQRFSQASSRSLPSNPVHLPEPPEADIQVMLKSLPEKGKLLQAVLQAGPLLQTLLLAGPLPQWRHPPPALDTVEIPRVSIPSPPISQEPCCNFRSNVPPPAPRLSSPNQVATRIGSTISTMQYSSPIGFCSTSKRLRRSSLVRGHGIGEDIRLTGGPLKYAKIY